MSPRELEKILSTLPDSANIYIDGDMDELIVFASDNTTVLKHIPL